MDDQMILEILKIDLGLAHNLQDNFLLSQIGAAREFIRTEGVTLTNSPGDQNLLRMYAAYLYRKRNTNEPMPRMLRFALNNRMVGGDGQ